MNALPRNAQQRQSGLSLVELMVALVIALILTIGVINIFLGTSQTYRLNEQYSRVQENARFVVDTLTRDIRQAGNLGCSQDFRLEDPPRNDEISNGFLRVTLNNPQDWDWDMSRPVEGFFGTGGGFSPALPAGFPAAFNDSDVLIVRGAEGGAMPVVTHPGGTPPGSANIQITVDNGLSQNDIVMVGDCNAGAVFQITSANPNTSGTLAHNTGTTSLPPGNWTTALGRDFESEGEVMLFRSRAFFVAQGASGQPALFQRVNGRAAEELVEGVERMRVRFGVDDNGNRTVDRYLNAQQVEAASGWDDVVTVRVSLLLVSADDNVLDQQQTITFDGAAVDPDDRRLRQVVTTTIGLRNRLP
ncbi:MAG: PilW family protein [Ectothiorhodospiraceae bacterium]|nr:PilW family protein [Ectothiorhodospiraceae bacterium]MCH8503698.1 PilW family protein [Ectothiorhodospiraceae bacterium]